MKKTLLLTSTIFFFGFTSKLLAQTSDKAYTTEKHQVKQLSVTQSQPKSNPSNYIYSNKQSKAEADIFNTVLRICDNDEALTRYIVHKIRLQHGDNSIKGIMSDLEYNALSSSEKAVYMSKSQVNSLIEETLLQKGKSFKN